MSKGFCPICQSFCLSPYRKSDDILVIGDAPSDDDLRQGAPFSTNTYRITAGKVFRKELERCGVAFNQLSVINIWQHIPTDNQECWEHGYNKVLEESKGKKAILLVGSDVVETFTKYKVSDVSGLQVDSHVLSAPIIYAMYSPALSLARGVGEVRLAVEKFIQRLEKEGLI